MNPLDLSRPANLMLAIVPELVLMGGSMFLLLWAAWRRDSDSHQRNVGAAALVLVGLTIGAVIWSMDSLTSVVPGGPVTIDSFRWAMDIVILLGAGLTIALAMDDNRREGIPTPETHVLILLAAGGMMLLAAATDMMIIFLGIELMSISVYALAGINRRSARSAEGALKYFLLGAFATAFLLYGIALVYGASGTTNIDGVAEAVRTLGILESPLLMVGLAMLVIGFGFKVAVAPFHMWAPDVYDGAPSAITAYMAATVKAAAFATFIRVWIHAFFGLGPEWYNAIYFVAVASMIVGNAIGLVQKNIKRMLAYSSIGHAGYLLVLIAAGTEEATSALVFYLLVYSLATFGAFAAIVTLARPGRGTVMIDELSGLWKRRPWLALGMGVMMLSLLGFPLFGGAGFFAKWYVLQVALHAPVPQTMLAIFIVLTSVLSAGYYLHVVMVMFMKPAAEDALATEPPHAGAMTRGVLVATVVLTILLGVVPDTLVRWTNQSRIARPAATRLGIVVPPMPSRPPTIAR